MYQNNMLNSRVVLRYSAGQLTGAIFAVGEYLVREDAVAKKTKLLCDERNRAARPPDKRGGDAVMQVAVNSDVRTWFAKLDALGAVPLLLHGRTQPKTPQRKILG
jgi:hypothetical protein